MPTHIETIKQLNDTLNAGSAINDLQSLRKTIEAMFKEGNPDIRTELAQLRKNIEPVLAGQVTNTARESWVKIANDLDRNYALIYSPEEGIGSISRYVNAAVNRVMQLGRENVSALENASPQTQNLVRTGVLAVGVTAGALAAGTIVYAGMKALWSAIRHPIITLTAVTGAIGSYIALGSTLRALPDSVRSYFPGWLNWIAGTAAPTTQPNQKQTAEQMKKLEEDRAAQEETTRIAIEGPTLGTTDPEQRRSMADHAVGQIDTELRMVYAIHTQNPTALGDRLKYLTEQRAAMIKLGATANTPAPQPEVKQLDAKAKEAKEKEAKQNLTKEMTKQFNDILMGITPGPLLRNPPGPPLRVGNMEVTLGPTSIFMTRNGARFRMDAQMEVEGVRHSFDLTRMERRVVNVPGGIIRAARIDHNIAFTELPQAYRTAAPWSSGQLISGVGVAEVSSNLAQAAVVFQGGANTYSKEFYVPFTPISFGTLHVNLIPA